MSAKHRARHRAKVKKRACLTKVRYTNLMQAMNAGVRTGLTWYRCPFCKGWHLTSKYKAVETEEND